MARFNADGSPSGRPSTDVFGNSVVLTGQALIDSNDEVDKRFGLGAYAGADTGSRVGGYGKKRVGEQSRGQMNLTGSRGSSILTS